MSISSHRCLCGLNILHPKPLEKILSVLHLGHEGAFLELLHLKSKEIVQLAHHRHLKLLHHYPAKILTRLLISRTKYYVISTYIWQTKRSPSQVFVNRVGSAFPTLNPLAIRKSLRHSYHALEACLSPKSALESIYTWSGYLSSSKPGGCSTYTSSLIGPFRKALFTSIWNNLKE
jgi:hypothetical protein